MAAESQSGPHSQGRGIGTLKSLAYSKTTHPEVVGATGLKKLLTLPQKNPWQLPGAGHPGQFVQGHVLRLCHSLLAQPANGIFNAAARIGCLGIKQTLS
jgi:hypothetical protein